MDYQVTHNRDSRLFSISGLDEEEAVLKYRPLGEEVLDFYRTFVDPRHRGKGLAALLVEAGLSWAREEGKKVLPSCSYVDRYMGEHPEHEVLRG